MLDAPVPAGYNAPVKARLLPSLALLILFSACARRTSVPVAATPAPYVRTTYVLAAEGAHGTRVSVTNEQVSNYGTTAESVRPLGSPALRQDQQRDLLRVKASVERR